MPELIAMLKDPDLQARKAAAYAIMNVADNDRALATLAQAAIDEKEYDVQWYFTRTVQLIQLGHERRQPDGIMAADLPQVMHLPPPIITPGHDRGLLPPVSHDRPAPEPPPPLPPKE